MIFEEIYFLIKLRFLIRISNNFFKRQRKMLFSQNVRCIAITDMSSILLSVTWVIYVLPIFLELPSRIFIWKKFELWAKLFRSSLSLCFKSFLSIFVHYEHTLLIRLARSRIMTRNKIAYEFNSLQPEWEFDSEIKFLCYFS